MGHRSGKGPVLISKKFALEQCSRAVRLAASSQGGTLSVQSTPEETGFAFRMAVCLWRVRKKGNQRTRVR
jgi:hypothetical protein